mmetsp:Transcript_23243/g.50379  ORF Transcript_23243/g.50379 Transcript_23243/m.50379 type:complete len:232 (+) Transcript_23243:156-851(+)
MSAEEEKYPADVNVSKDFVVGQVDGTINSFGAENVDTADKVAQLTRSLSNVSAQLDELKQTSTMDRLELVKELDALKKMKFEDKTHKETEEQKEEPKAEKDDALTSLRSEFEQFKRVSTLERDSLARELDLMKQLKREEEDAAEDEIAYYKEAGLLETEEDDMETRKAQQQHRSPIQSKDPKDSPDDKYAQMRQCEADVKNQAEGSVQSILAAISEQFDDEGYMKCCMPEN